MAGDALIRQRVRWEPGAAVPPARRARSPARADAHQRGVLLALVLACIVGAVLVDAYLLPGLPAVWLYAAAVLLAAACLPVRYVAATGALAVAVQAASLAWDGTPLAALLYESAGLAIIAALAVALTHHRLALRTRTAEAEAAIRARDEFLAIASHELRTPLTVLWGHAELLVRQLDKAASAGLDLEATRQRAHTIELHMQRLARLVEQLLDLSRLDTGKLALERSNVDVAELVEATVAAVRELSPAYEIVVRRPPSLPAHVDALRLAQVLTNLVGNAIKYSSAGGPIEVELAPVPAHPGAPPWVRLAVRDHGVGIPAEHRERIFGRFEQAHGAGHLGGLGLGLHISRQIVELHGGRIDVECPADGGTRFTVMLPDGGAGADATSAA